MKNRILNHTTWLLLLIVVLATGLLSYLKFALPSVGDAPELKVEVTQTRIERGKYLANHVNACIDCHSSRDWNKFAGPPIKGTFGQGGEAFDQKLGFPGSYYAQNITPSGIGDWTDGELFRAITSGVSKDGKALFPVMPHPAYGKMDEEDILSIITYLRTLKPIENKVPASKSDFPMNFIINTIPSKPNFSKIPTKSNQVTYGKYLITAADCITCHSKHEQGAIVEGMEYAGGFEFELPTGGIVRSANITPDKETGIGNWSREAFINRFKIYADSSVYTIHITKGDFNTVMPWTMYAGMSEEDLGAIYAYLQTLKPVHNQVEKFTGLTGSPLTKN